MDGCVLSSNEAAYEAAGRTVRREAGPAPREYTNASSVPTPTLPRRRTHLPRHPPRVRVVERPALPRDALVRHPPRQAPAEGGDEVDGRRRHLERAHLRGGPGGGAKGSLRAVVGRLCNGVPRTTAHERTAHGTQAASAACDGDVLRPITRPRRQRGQRHTRLRARSGRAVRRVKVRRREVDVERAIDLLRAHRDQVRGIDNSTREKRARLEVPWTLLPPRCAGASAPTCTETRQCR